ncbi:MAG: ribosome recycling factor [Pseudomonadota bacterium]
MADKLINDLKRRMEGALEVLGHEFNGLRTGRASTALLEPITVDAYGSKMPLNQVSSVTVPEARLLSVQVWDQGMVKAVEKAISDAGLGLNPTVDGQTLRISLPELTEERRIELQKVARKYAESARVAIRNVRRDGMENLKKQEKDGELSEDEHHRASHKVQDITDEFVHKIDEILAAKEQDILKV